MSVTFTFAQYRVIEGETVLYAGTDCKHTCPITDSVCEDFLLYSYCDHIEDARDACGCEAFDVNMANGNAAQALARLGFDTTELVGQADPDDLLGRALVANVGRDDSGVPVSEHGGPGTGLGARMIDCGLPAGYFDDRIGQIVALAVEAKRREVLISWG